MKKLLLTFCFIAVSLSTFAQSWVSQASGFASPSRGISDLKIIDANTVWGLAYDGTTAAANVQEFTRTIDGGSTWTPGVINVGDVTYQIVNLSAIDAMTAWAGAINPSVTGVTDPNDGIGVIYKTTNGGTTWVRQNAAGFQTVGTVNSFLDGVHFFDANNGLAFGDPLGTTFEIYTTSDGGVTWTPATSPAVATNEYGYTGNFAYAGNTFWFTTSKGKIYRTNDKGLTWTKLASPLSDFGAQVATNNIGNIYFSDNNNGIIVGAKNYVAATATTASTGTYKIYRTTDGGTNWSAGVTYTGFRNMCYIPGTTKIVATSASTATATSDGSSYSNDNGVTWTTIETGIQRLAPAFLNETTGWCGGFNADPFTGGVFKFSGSLINPTFEANKNFNIYPNPANTLVSISSTLEDSYKLKVVDLMGKIIIEKQFTGVENTLDVSALTCGMYFFTFTSDTKSETIKIIKN
jgi:photosystem II stability/assembly factor-like uncharacterized protein